MAMNKKIIAVIPARGGSKGLARKNVRTLAGKPLIAHTICATRNSKLIDRVFVSTEDEEIAEISQKYGAEIIKRPPELAGDYVITAPVLKHAVEWLKKKENYKPDIIVYLQATDIFRKKGLIDAVIGKLINNPHLDSFFAAYPTHKNFWQKINGEYKRLTKKGMKSVRQKKEPIFREDTGIVSAVWAKLVKKGDRIGKRVGVVENDDPLSFIDIHSEFDLNLTETIISQLRKKNLLKEYEICQE